MGWFTKSDPDEAERKRESIRRGDAWGTALNRGTLPDFIEARLKDAAAKRPPWLSTLTPAELLLARSHGVRPVATVSGTCWFHYGWSWTEGHAEGWHTAIARMKQEAIAAGANAILDVKLRTVRIGNTRDSMDYTVLGTAVSIDGLPPSRDPVVATVPAIEFVRLLEAGIVTVGVAIGARYDWLTASTGTFGWLGMNGNCGQLTTFWEDVRRQAARRPAARYGPPRRRRARSHPFRPVAEGRGRRKYSFTRARPPHRARHRRSMRASRPPCPTTSEWWSTCATTCRRSTVACRAITPSMASRPTRKG